MTSVPTAPNERSSSPEPSRRTLARNVLGLGLIVGLFVLLSPSWSEVLAVVRFDAASFGFGFAFSTAAILVTAARWKLLNEAWGNDRLPFAAYLYQLSLTRVLGQLTSVVAMDLVGRSLALRSAGSRRSFGQLVAPVLVERVLDVVIPVVMIGWAIAVVEGPLGPYAGLSFAAVGLLAVALGGPLLVPISDLALRLYRRVGRWRGRTVVEERPVIDRRTAWWTAVLGLVRYVTVCFQFVGMGAAAGVMLPIVVVLAAAPVAQLSSMVGITPGGLGIQEAGWAGALLWQGVSQTDIAVFVVATRAFMLVNSALVAAASWPFMRWAMRRVPS